MISDKKKHLTKIIFETLKAIEFDIQNFGFKKKKLNSIRLKLLKQGFEKVNYIEILKEKNLSKLDSKPSKSRIFISITIDGIRLIDNIAIRKKLVEQKGLIKTVK